jgi:hypothetical protein
MTEITYIKHPNKLCAGNPLIEGLGYPLTIKQVQTLCDEEFEGLLSLEGVPDEHHSYYVRSVIDNLVDTYVVQDEAYAIYEKLRRMIEAGYKKRNPANYLQKNKITTAVHMDGDDQLNAFHLKKVTGDDVDSLLTANGCYILAGLSGRGKTTLMLRLLKLIQQRYSHSTYIKSSGEEVDINEEQLVYLYVQLHERKGQKAFLRSILQAVENALGKKYSDLEKTTTSVDQMIKMVRKLLLTHNVGVLIIDEAQNFAQSPETLVIGNNEKTSMKFVEEIFNRIGVPLFLIGTMDSLTLFGKEMTIGRRSINDGSTLMLGCDVDGEFWKRLSERICRFSLLKGKHSKADTIKRHLHTLTFGIPAIAISLMRATLSHLSKFKPGEQNLSIKSMNYVFRQQFSILDGPLKALRKKKYHKYEGMKVLAVLSEINDDISDDEKQYAPISETSDKASEHVEGEKVSGTSEQKVSGTKPASKKRKKSVVKKSKIPEMDMATANKIGVNQLLALSRGPKRAIMED